MHNILNDVFEYDTMQLFRSGIIELKMSFRNPSCPTVYDFMDGFKRHSMMGDVNCKCALCSNTGASYRLVGGIWLHMHCLNILNNIRNNDYIGHIKLRIGNIERLLTVYGFVDKCIISCNGSHIESWKIEINFGWDKVLNMYNCINTVRKGLTFVRTQCSCCGTDIPYLSDCYNIDTSTYCVECCGRMVAFKDDLCTKYMLLNYIGVKDITVVIIRAIISVYQAICDFNNV